MIRITDLEKDEKPSLGAAFMVATDSSMGAPMNKSVTIGDIKKVIMSDLHPTPLNKCNACGQWGAAYCPCRHCGSPVDPGEHRSELL